MGSSVGVKTHQNRDFSRKFALTGDFFFCISEFLPQAKTTFRPLSESGYWAFAVWGLGEGFVVLYNERATQLNEKLFLLAQIAVLEQFGFSKLCCTSTAF